MEVSLGAKMKPDYFAGATRISVYNQISNILKEQYGINRSGSQCRDKIKQNWNLLSEQQRTTTEKAGE